MIENRFPPSASLDPLYAGGAEAPWVERDSSAEPVKVRGKRVLIVEDEEPLRACLRMILELEGYQITEAGNGAEALNLFNIGEFDLVITDFEMPMMKGNELAASIKRLAPSLPILMITASEMARGEVDNPVDAFLNKPLTVPDLRCTIAKLLLARPEPAQPSVVSSLESPSAAFAPEEQILAPVQA